ncbi:indole-3-glycerol phosphate synthase TrpC [Peribacillus asahii]|uniref:Indole-3-glycerol phosphate synthase n=1 Tax=Peribacillus asahii TaxID=228899 RepID=A0A3T0KNZ6_9BACI|nr:indole-3-glycerol phosphate synthase TrpC [Peribacillus asahii]AZV42116.1 indole-3-glycerol phosphate synthase [Peribacillus asahii]USK86438.1 indole-3-glycerol phosphate synthase TrpC [Peribacillus asahii]
MGNILTKIIDEKEIEVARLKETGLTGEALQVKRPSLVEQLRTATSMSVIAEIKRASPSKGEINLDVNPVEQALTYERNGAAAISVLTDEKFFKGRIEDLQQVSQNVAIPRLCKDFMVDEIQIDRAYESGATVILLIVAALSQERLQALYTYAKQKGLDVLTEVHDEEELERALAIDAEIIGINNRNLKTFEVDLAVTERLASRLDSNRHLIISESGIKTVADVERVKKAGARGILVGETLMQAADLPETLKQFQLTL